MPSNRNSTSWAPYGLAGLKPSLPDEEIVEKLRKSSKYFSKIITTKEKNLSKIDDSEEIISKATKSQRKEKAGLKAVQEIEELRKDKAKYATWMETLISDEYIGKNNDEINVLIVSNVIKVCAIACPEIPFRNKEAATEIFEIVLEVFPKVVNVDNHLFDDYCEILNIFYLYDIESVITDWIGENCLRLTEKLLTSVIKCAELIIPSSPSGMIIKKVGELGSLLVKILVQVLSNMCIDIQTLDVLFYYLVQPQKTNFKKSFELCCKALSKDDASVAVVGAGKVIRESLIHNSLYSGKRTGDKLFNVIHSLEKTIPGFINDMINDIQRLAISGHNDKARYCLWICAAEPNSKVLHKISNPKHIFQYRSEWTDAQKTQNVGLIGKIIENNDERTPYIDSYIASLFKDTHNSSKLEMLNTIYSIATKDFSKISEKILESIGRLVIDPEEAIRHKAMILLGSIHRLLYTNNVQEVYKERVIHALSYYFNYINHTNHSDIQRLEKILVSSILSSGVSDEEKLNILEKLFICFNSNGIFTFRVIIQNRSKLFEIVRYTVVEYKETSTVQDKHTKNEFLNIYSSQNASTLYDNLPKIYEALNNLEIFQDLHDTYTSGKLSIGHVERKLSELLRKLTCSSIDKKNVDEFRKLIERSAPLFIDASFGKCILSSLLKLSEGGKKANVLKISYLTSIAKQVSKEFGFNFLFLNSLNMLAKIISHFDIEPISDCGMYILKNIFTSNIKFEIPSEDKDLLTNIIMESFEKATPKAVKYGIFVLLHITPMNELKKLVSDLTSTFSNRLKKDSSQCGRSLTILSEISRYKKLIKSENLTELSFTEGFWENLVEKAMDIIENGPRDLSDDYKIISNNDLRETIMDPSSKNLDAFEKKYSYAATHNGVRLPLSMGQFAAFPLYYDTSTHNIVSAVNFIHNVLTNHLQKDTKLIEKIASIYRDILMEKSNYWIDFSYDQESTIKYYISKTLLFLKLNSDLDAFLDFTNLVAVSKCLYDTDYDIRSKIVVKISNNVNRGGMPLLSLLPLVLYSSKHNVANSIEKSFRICTMRAFSHLISLQQKLSHICKSKKDYYSFFLSEYSIAYTIICIALTSGYNNFRDMDIIKKATPVFEGILLSYNNLSKILNISLVKNVLSEIKESKLSLISEGRTESSPFIDADFRVWVLAELCLCLGELVFGIFGTTTQIAPDVVFWKSIFVKTKRSTKQVSSMNAAINELCQATKKPTKVIDVIVKSLISHKKANITKEVKPKNHGSSNQDDENKKQKKLPAVTMDGDDEEGVSSLAATRLKNRKARTEKEKSGNENKKLKEIPPIIIDRDDDESDNSSVATRLRRRSARTEKKKSGNFGNENKKTKKVSSTIIDIDDDESDNSSVATRLRRRSDRTEKEKSGNFGNENKKSKEIRPRTIDKNNEGNNSSSIATRLRGRSVRTKEEKSDKFDSGNKKTKKVTPMIIDKDDEESDSSSITAGKRKVKARKRNSNHLDNKSKKTKEVPPIIIDKDDEESDSSRITTRLRGKRIVSEDSMVSSNLSTPKRTNVTVVKKSSKEKRGRSSLRRVTMNRSADDDDYVSIENVSIITPDDDEKSHSTSLFDMAEKEEKKKETRKRRALSRDQENGMLNKKSKKSFKEPLASSTPYISTYI